MKKKRLSPKAKLWLGAMLFFGTIAFIIIAGVMTGCTGQGKLKRLEAKHPELFTIHAYDTIRPAVVKESEEVHSTYKRGATTFEDSLSPKERLAWEALRLKEHFGNRAFGEGEPLLMRVDTLVKTITILDTVKVTEVRNTSGLAIEIVVKYVTHWYDYVCRTITVLSLLTIIIALLVERFRHPIV